MQPLHGLAVVAVDEINDVRAGGKQLVVVVDRHRQELVKKQGGRPRLVCRHMHVTDARSRVNAVALVQLGHLVFDLCLPHSDPVDF